MLLKGFMFMLSSRLIYCVTLRNVCDLMIVGTYQQNFDAAKDVHGTCEGRPQVEADPNSSTELRPQWARDHVVWTSSYETHTHTHTGVTILNCSVTHTHPHTHSDVHSPGTTPFVAMALMEMAVSMVWGNKPHTQRRVTGAWDAAGGRQLKSNMADGETWRNWGSERGGGKPPAAPESDSAGHHELFITVMTTAA